MSNVTSNRSDSSPALIVYGRLADVELPQAGWFRNEHSQAASDAATAVKLSVMRLESDELKALAAKVPEGSLKSSGRIVLGSISPETHHLIEERARNHASSAVGT